VSVGVDLQKALQSADFSGLESRESPRLLSGEAGMLLSGKKPLAQALHAIEALPCYRQLALVVDIKDPKSLGLQRLPRHSAALDINGNSYDEPS
jgi:hypothetical protein